MIEPIVVPAAHLSWTTQKKKFRNLMRAISAGKIVIPNLQDMEPWDFDKARNFLAHVCLFCPVMPIVLQHIGKGRLEVVEGRQRILALYLFYKGLRITKKKITVPSQDMSLPEAIEAVFETEPSPYPVTYIQTDGREKTIDISYKSMNKSEKELLNICQGITLIEISACSSDRGFAEKVAADVARCLSS